MINPDVTKRVNGDEVTFDFPNENMNYTITYVDDDGISSETSFTTTKCDSTCDDYMFVTVNNEEVRIIDDVWQAEPLINTINHIDLCNTADTYNQTLVSFYFKTSGGEYASANDLLTIKVIINGEERNDFFSGDGLKIFQPNENAPCMLRYYFDESKVDEFGKYSFIQIHIFIDGCDTPLILPVSLDNSKIYTVFVKNNIPDTWSPKENFRIAVSSIDFDLFDQNSGEYICSATATFNDQNLCFDPQDSIESDDIDHPMIIDLTCDVNYDFRIKAVHRYDLDNPYDLDICKFSIESVDHYFHRVYITFDREVGGSGDCFCNENP